MPRPTTRSPRSPAPRAVSLCKSLIGDLTAGSGELARHVASLQSRCRASAIALCPTWSGLGPALDSLARSTTAYIRRVCDERLKALEAEAEVWRVGSEQCDALARLCDDWAGDGGAPSPDWLSWATSVCIGLLFGGDGSLPLCSSTFVIAPSPLAIDATAARSMRLCHGVNVAACTMKVACRGRFIAGTAQDAIGRNVVTVICVDADGDAAPVCLEDVAVTLDVGTVTHVRGEGEVRACFCVPDASHATAILSVSVCGSALPTSPWLLSRCDEARGEFVRTLPLAPGLEQCRCHTGIAVSADGALLVRVGYGAPAVTVYSLPDGACIRVFGMRGDGPACFDAPEDVCFTPAGTLLIAESSNRRVQEVSVTGEHIRFIGARSNTEWLTIESSNAWLNEEVTSVATNGRVIAAGKGIRSTPGRIFLFDAATGNYLRRFAGFGNEPGELAVVRGLCFAPVVGDPGGAHIIVADAANSRVCVFDADSEGLLLATLGEGVLEYPMSVTVSQSGDVIVLDRDGPMCVSVFSPEGALIRQWGPRGLPPSNLKATSKGQPGPEGRKGADFDEPWRFCMHQQYMYILDRSFEHIKVFQ